MAEPQVEYSHTVWNMIFMHKCREGKSATTRMRWFASAALNVTRTAYRMQWQNHILKFMICIIHILPYCSWPRFSSPSYPMHNCGWTQRHDGEGTHTTGIIANQKTNIKRALNNTHVNTNSSMYSEQNERAVRLSILLSARQSLWNRKQFFQ